MATHRIPILGFSTIPDTSGDVFFEPYSILATNDVWAYLVAIFNDTSTRLGLRGKFDVPQNYVGSPQIIPIWTSTATSGNAVWDFDYRAVGGNDIESLDQTGTQESVTVTDAAPSAIHERLESPMALTAGNLAAGDTVQFEAFRDGTASDTIAAQLILHDLLFEYSDV